MKRPWKNVRPAVSVRALSSCRKTSAISSSFQTHTALTTTIVTIAGADSGTITLHSVRSWPAPSMRAASSRLRGMVAKKFTSR